MQHSMSKLARELLFLSICVVLLGFLTMCGFPPDKRDIEVTSKTTYSGSVNGSPIEIEVTAKINTGHGGSSTCLFGALPPGFNPATLGTFT